VTVNPTGKEDPMTAQRIEQAVALVTGANRGIGRALTEALLNRGVRKVYATARNPEALRALSGSAA
jgi:NAD(P)-dependent dehydrogenase (short-subunit alcohol dehydrogenase family)